MENTFDRARKLDLADELSDFGSLTGIKDFTTSEDKWFGLDSSSVEIEKVPLVIRTAENVKLKRVYS